jgi:hypothetical protein
VVAVFVRDKDRPKQRRIKPFQPHAYQNLLAVYSGIDKDCILFISNVIAISVAAGGQCANFDHLFFFRWANLGFFLYRNGDFNMQLAAGFWRLADCAGMINEFPKFGFGMG